MQQRPAPGTYRIQFQVAQPDPILSPKKVWIEVAATTAEDALVKAVGVARRVYGDGAKPTSVITYTPAA